MRRHNDRKAVILAFARTTLIALLMVRILRLLEVRLGNAGLMLISGMAKKKPATLTVTGWYWCRPSDLNREAPASKAGRYANSLQTGKKVPVASGVMQANFRLDDGFALGASAFVANPIWELHPKAACAAQDVAWSRQQGSNSRPLVYKTSALPSELCRPTGQTGGECGIRIHVPGFRGLSLSRRAPSTARSTLRKVVGTG
jgi:hypothetical protein